MLDRYFQEELSYLREQGKEFAELNPKLVRYLSEASTDPDVERLLEGFAFLTSRIRRKLDDELPELTSSLINLIWPNFMRPVPSISMIKFAPQLKAISERQMVPAGTALASKPVGGTSCKFRTTADCTIYPMELENLELYRSRKESRLNLSFRTLGGIAVGKIGLKDLRLNLIDEGIAAYTLYLWLNRYCSSIRIGVGEQVIEIPRTQMSPGAFDETEALLPRHDASFDGYRLLQEYFYFPEKFLCVDLKDIGRHLEHVEEDGFQVEFEFEQPIPADVKIWEQHVQLYCAPCINLFELSAEPIRIDQRRVSYPVLPANRLSNKGEIFSVDRVESWRLASGHGDGAGKTPRGETIQYKPFESFDHEFERMQEHKQVYYRLVPETNASGQGIRYAISFVRHDNAATLPAEETVSLDLTCFNGDLAHELAVGDICVPTEETPSFATYENVLRPTQTVYPPIDGRNHWNMISNLSLNYASLLDKDALSAIISIYDFRALYDRQSERAAKRRIDSIVDLTTTPIDRLINGMPVRGLKSELVLKSTHFECEGEMYLFASILAEFFTMYSSINAFHTLEVISHETRENYQWHPKPGQQPLI